MADQNLVDLDKNKTSDAGFGVDATDDNPLMNDMAPAQLQVQPLQQPQQQDQVLQQPLQQPLQQQQDQSQNAMQNAVPPVAAQVVQAQGNVRRIPNLRLTSNTDKSSTWVRYMARMRGAYPPSDEECADKVGQLADDIVKEFHPKGSVGIGSGWRRKHDYKRKKKIYSSTVVDDWRLRKSGAPVATAPHRSVADPTKLKPETRKDLYDMMQDNTDYLGYIDDEALLAHFSTMYEKLEQYKKIGEDLAQPEWDDPGVPAILKRCKALENYTVKDFRDKAESMAKFRQFYEAKMDLFTNPFYIILKKKDTAKMKTDDIEKMRDSFAQDKPELSSYLDIILRLRKLEKDETKRTHKHEASAIRTDFHDGLDKSVKAHMSAFNAKADWSFAGSKYGLKVDETIIEDATKSKNTGALQGEANLTLNLMEGKVDLTTKSGQGKSSAEFVVGEVKAYGKASASLFNSKMLANRSNDDPEDEKVEGADGYVGLELGAKASALRGKVSGSYFTKKKWENIKLFGFSASASAEAFTASAYGTAKAGVFTEKDDEKTEVEGVSFMAGASASLLSGRASADITFMGVKFSLSTSGNLGSVGTSVGYVLGKGKVGLSLGAALGVGFGVDFGIDASEVLEFARLKAKKYWNDPDTTILEKLNEKRKKAYAKFKALVSDSGAAVPAQQQSQGQAQAQQQNQGQAQQQSQQQNQGQAQQQSQQQNQQQAAAVQHTKEIEKNVSDGYGEETGRIVGLAHADEKTFTYPRAKNRIHLDDACFVKGELSESVSEGKLFDKDEPINPEEIKQSTKVNDCYLIATLAGLALRDPDYIKNSLIKEDEKDKNYVLVSLYDEKGDPQRIRVQKTGWKGDKRPLWIQLVEKAALALVGFNKDHSEKAAVTYRYASDDKKDWKNPNYEPGKFYRKELDMGVESLAVELIFGKNGIHEKMIPTQEPNASQLKEGDKAIGKALAWCNAGMVVTASTGNVDMENIPDSLWMVVQSNHVYTVLGEGNQIDGKRTLRLRDPYGARGNKGIIEVSFEDFRYCFTDVTATGPQDADRRKNEE